MAKFLAYPALLLAVLYLALWSTAAGAQEIKGFAVDMIELYDEDENYVDEVSVSDIKDVEVLDVDKKVVGMLRVMLNGKPYWINDSDVILSGTRNAQECQTVARPGETRLAATMGLGC